MYISILGILIVVKILYIVIFINWLILIDNIVNYLVIFDFYNIIRVI